MHERIETSNVYHTCAYVRFRLWPQWAWLRGKGAFTNQRDYISSVLLCVCSERQHREFKWSSRRLSAYLCSYFFAMINALNSVNRQPCSFKLVNALVQVQIKLICKCTVASNQARCGHISMYVFKSAWWKFWQRHKENEHVSRVKTTICVKWDFVPIISQMYTQAIVLWACRIKESGV